MRIAKLSYRAFELLHAVGTELVTPVDGMHPTVDAWVVGGNHGMDVAVIITNHAYPRHSLVLGRVLVLLKTARRPRAATRAQLDDDHANAKRRWNYPSRVPVNELHAASVLARRPHQLTCNDGGVHVQVDVPSRASRSYS
jgi:xylan 1,4-beta-xylosidase